MNPLVVVHPEVAQALADKRPVVALESTIITHGMPWPQNLETAQAVEAAVRAGGGVPATIAILKGRIHVGLAPEDLEALARATGALKLSRADLPYAVGLGRDGSTTVAATMICAALAGIEVFATGGIGGVHRGAETSFDVSADLEELAQTPVIVVCAGAKAILDLPKTLEVLETKGVPVAGWRTDAFPAFWSRSSGLKAPLRLDHAEEAARLWRAKGALGLKGGLLIANPIAPEAEIPAPLIEAAIAQALASPEAAQATGKAATPWMLSKVVAATGGASLTANIALILGNARLAAEIAGALTQRQA